MLSNIGWRGCKKFPKGAILFVCIGSTIGKLGIASTSLSANQQINGVVPSEHVDRDFLYYRLSLAAKEIRAQASEQAVPIINKTTFGGLQMFLPPLNEQEAIAEALSDADALIDGLERLVAKKRLIKQGVMQDLLTAKRRLPGFSGEWVETKLSEHTTHGAGNSSLIKGTLQKSGRIGDYPAFTASGPDLMLDFHEQVGDAIIVSAVGSRCGKSFRARDKWTAIANTHVVRCKPTLDADFAFLFLNDEDFWVKGGTGQPFVLVRRTFERDFWLPNLDEQRAIATVIMDMDTEIHALEARIEKARQVKEGMMQNLLTGRIRLV